MQVSSELKSAYDNQYDDAILYIRNLAAKHKAANIIKLSKNIPHDHVLEVGCGEGSILKWLDANNFSENLYAVEISETGIQQTLKKQIPSLKEIKLFDGYKIPYEDNRFDLCICSHVIEHVEHPRLLIREIKRVSKYQFYEIPVDYSYKVDKNVSHFLSYGHINIFTPPLFRFLLKSEGYNILHDITDIYHKEILDHYFKNKTFELFKYRLKSAILKYFPRFFKPGFYSVLTDKTREVKILQ